MTRAKFRTEQLRIRVSIGWAIGLMMLIPQVVAMPSPALAGTTKRCSSIGSSVGAGYSHIRAHGVSCRTARRVLSPYRAPLPGWAIEHHPTYDRFTHGTAWVTGVPLGD